MHKKKENERKWANLNMLSMAINICRNKYKSTQQNKLDHNSGIEINFWINYSEQKRIS
jgi:hypothetical protein